MTARRSVETPPILRLGHWQPVTAGGHPEAGLRHDDLRTTELSRLLCVLLGAVDGNRTARYVPVKSRMTPKAPIQAKNLLMARCMCSLSVYSDSIDP